MLAQAFSTKFIVLYIFILASLYTHFRGKVRHKFLRQLSDHSTFMAPINAIMYLFSAVPNQPYLEVQKFPELSLLRENWKTIREEAENLVKLGHIKASDSYDDAGFNSFFRTGWKRFYLKWYENFLPSAQTHCPKTVELLNQIPNIKGAMFALLSKNGRLVRHRDPYAGSLRYHLGLITPNSEKCCIYVDGIKYHWKDGEDVMFDETFIHYAENETDEDRIVLFCDVERPLRNRIATAFNRLFSKYVMSGSATKNSAGDPVGFVNKAFQYLYQIRLLGKRLKNYNRKLYYTVKYLLFAAILLLIFYH